MTTLIAPIRPPLPAAGRTGPTHHRIVARTVTVTREFVIDDPDEPTLTTVAGLDRAILRLALWLIERRRVRSLRVRVDSAEMSRRVDAAKQRHLDRYHGLPL